jgi:hypothetical protein
MLITEADRYEMDRLQENERRLYTVNQISQWYGLSQEERDVLIAVRHCQRERTALGKGSKGWAHASYGQLGDAINRSRQFARKLLRGLRDKKVIEMNASDKAGRGFAFNFTIHEQGCCHRPEQRGRKQRARHAQPNSATKFAENAAKHMPPVKASTDNEDIA